MMANFAALPPHSAERLRLSEQTQMKFWERLRLGAGEAPPRRRTKLQRPVRQSHTALCGGTVAKASRQNILKKFSGLASRVALFWIVAVISLAGLHSFRATRAQEVSRTEARIDPIALHQALLDLNNPWTVMCIAAHPDDEDGTSLTVLRHKYGVHTVSVFSTYGEGGQNAVGPQLYEELGVIRARETMAAAEIQGSEPYFLGLKDFGFSKSADEAFKVWGHDEALRRMVLKIRQLRPDVIITNHDTTSGHGHHQATGRLLLEAFDAAADPKRYADQLQAGIEPWQVKRIFVRTGFGNSAAQKPDESGLVAIDPNESDPVRNTSYAEQALQALRKHETQGPWPKSVADMARFRNSPDGRLPMIRYKLTREANDAAPLPQNSSTVLDGLQLPEAARTELSLPLVDGHPLIESEKEPDRVLTSLIVVCQAHGFRSGSPDEAPRFRLMNERLNHALALLSGINITLSANDAVLVPNTTAVFSVSLANNGNLPVKVNKLNVHSWGSESQIEIADQLPVGTEAVKTIENLTPADASISVPSAEHLYDGHLLGESLIASAEVELLSARFLVNAEIKRDVAPAVEIKDISPSPYVRTLERMYAQFDVTLVNNLATPFSGVIVKQVSNNISPVRTQSQAIALKPYETLKVQILDINPVPPRESIRTEMHSGSVLFSIEALAPGAALSSVGQRDSITSVTRRTIPMNYVDVRVAHNLRVGYIPSFDGTVAKALAELGVEAKELSLNDIQNGDLKAYNSIIIDNRGYEAHPELIAANDRLLTYASDGGTLIVFYHKNNEWNPDPNRKRPQLSPYPITLGGERVTDENAPVSFLQPRHPLLNSPNKIQSSDFAGWVQERGLYYPKEWDAHYAALLAMNDPGEASLRGGLLVGAYGRGQYIYTSMVWYRELRAGVPGAYRMLANMISYGRR